MAKVLVLSPTFPCPMQSGGQVRLFHVLKHLTDHGHQVTLLSFLLPDQVPHRGEAEAVCRRVETVAGRDEHGVWDKLRGRLRLLEFRRALTKVRQAGQGIPYQYFRFAHPEMTRLFRRLLSQERYDFVQAEYSQMAPYLADPAVRASGARSVLVEIDVSFVAADRTARTTRGIGNLLVRWEARRMMAYHRAILPGIFRVVTMSEEDARFILDLYPDARTCVVPNGVDTHQFAFTPRTAPENRKLLFVGGSGHPPNVDGMEFFDRQILPRIRSACPGTTLTVIGAFQQRPGQFSPELRFAGFVEDLSAPMAGHAVFVVPLRIGSGTRLKILEAFSAGIPVVSTRVGAEGIRVRDGENILLADRPEAFAGAVVRLLNDPALARRIAEGARETAVSLYSWEQVLRPLEQLYTGGGRDPV